MDERHGCDQTVAQRWPARLLTLEAMVLLTIARVLVQAVRFRRWRASLGIVGTMSATDCGSPAAWRDHYLANVVARAAGHLPFETRCLPRAMALHWMLARRGGTAQLVMAVLPGENRGGSLDDLHAWVETGGDVLIGASALNYVEIARFSLGGTVQ